MAANTAPAQGWRGGGRRAQGVGWGRHRSAGWEGYCSAFHGRKQTPRRGLTTSARCSELSGSNGSAPSAARPASGTRQGGPLLLQPPRGGPATLHTSAQQSGEKSAAAGEGGKGGRKAATPQDPLSTASVSFCSPRVWPCGLKATRASEGHSGSVNSTPLETSPERIAV